MANPNRQKMFQYNRIMIYALLITMIVFVMSKENSFLESITSLTVVKVAVEKITSTFQLK